MNRGREKGEKENEQADDNNNIVIRTQAFLYKYALFYVVKVCWNKFHLIIRLRKCWWYSLRPDGDRFP